MHKLIAICSGVFGFSIALGGGEAVALPLTAPSASKGTAITLYGQAATDSYTLPTWLSEAGEHWLNYWGTSYIDTNSIRETSDSEYDKDVVEYWTLVAGRNLTKVFLFKKYLDCNSMTISFVSSAIRDVDGFPSPLSSSKLESDHTYETKYYESIVPGDPDKKIAQDICSQLSR